MGVLAPQWPLGMGICLGSGLQFRACAATRRTPACGAAGRLSCGNLPRSSSGASRLPALRIRGGGLSLGSPP
eukprot:5746551-Alexandrium_andersonii.AAC.1